MMKKSFQDLLSDIPEYTRFFTVDEHEQNNAKLAKRFPKVVTRLTIGYSSQKRPITCLKIGNGSRTALMYGCPHPNEPIGAMMLDHLASSLAENEQLRRELDYTFYLVKVWDVDSTALNETWFGGPFTLHNYTMGYYRPPGKRQVDRTFPIDYKFLHYHNCLPETNAMKRLIDEVKPNFVYSLHNSGFGGVFWYISDNFRELFPKLHWVARKNGLPLDMGEPDAPYLEVFDRAIFKTPAIRDRYDYLEKYGVDDVPGSIPAGNNDAAYARENYRSVTLTTELPYFFDPRIGDRRQADAIRRDYVLERLEFNEKLDVWLKENIAGLQKYMSPQNPFFTTLSQDGQAENPVALRNLIAESPDFAKRGTVAEEFSNRFVSRFDRAPYIGYVARACEWELEHMHSEGIIYAEKAAELENARGAALEKHNEVCVEMERMAEYQVVPISTLISIQLESGLIVLDYLQQSDKPETGFMPGIGGL